MSVLSKEVIDLVDQFATTCEGLFTARSWEQLVGALATLPQIVQAIGKHHPGVTADTYDTVRGSVITGIVRELTAMCEMYMAMIMNVTGDPPPASA